MRILHQKLKLQGNNPNPADREKQSPLFLERGGLCSSLGDFIYDLVKPAMRFLMAVIMMSCFGLFDLFDLFKLQENLSVSFGFEAVFLERNWNLCYRVVKGGGVQGEGFT